MADLVMYSYLLAGLLEILIPLLLGFYIKRKFGTEWRVYAIGGIMFMLSLIRIPLNNVVSTFAQDLSGFVPWILLFGFPSLMAGIFEEIARYLAFRYLVRAHSNENGLMYGAGHGGVESVFIVGISVTTIGLLLVFSPSSIPLDQLMTIYSIPFWMPFVGLYERIMAMMLQMGLSIIVLQTFIKEDYTYLLMAVLFHFTVDFLALTALGSYGILGAEIVVTVSTVVICYFVWRNYMETIWRKSSSEEDTAQTI